MRITKKTDYLEAELLNDTVRLIPQQDGLLKMSHRPPRLIPETSDRPDHVFIYRDVINGRNILVARIDDRNRLLGERLKQEVIPEPWQQRTGEYEIINEKEDTVLLDNINLRYREGLLLLEFTLPYATNQAVSLILTPVSDTETVIFGLGHGKGETVSTVTRNGKELLAYAGYLLRKKAP